MKIRSISIIAGVTMAFGLTTTAQASVQPQTGTLAANSITSGKIKNGTIQKRDLRNGLINFIKAQGRVGNDGNVTVNAPKGDTGALGATGSAGAVGPVGPEGPQGETGSNGMFGAYYAVANYNAGDTNSGAVATVACVKETDVAISGGVQTLALDGTPLDNNTPVSSSFPGRMNWDTNSPRENRLDGWIVQFGGSEDHVTPLRVKVYALCLPGQDIPVVETFTQVG